MAGTIEKHSESISDEVVRIAKQAQDTFASKGCRWDTYFYKVVLAGNVSAIKQVVAHLEGTESMQTLDWLFQRNEFEENRHAKMRKSKRLLITRVAVCLLLAIVNILLTPVFYALHILSTTFLNRKQKRISANIKLPLAYAAFSRKREMVKFFLSKGVDVTHIDDRGNNIFHYIADLSAVAANNAIQIFSNMVYEVDDVDCVKKMLEKDRNSAGLTAVEYAAKFGSPSLLAAILRHPSIMHHTPFSASAHHVAFNEDKTDGERASPEDGDVTRIEVVDVSMYEAGALTDQSTLLNILSDRDIASMSRDDLQIFANGGFIGKWLKLKCRQMVTGIVFFEICDFILTCLMLYFLSTSFIGTSGIDENAWLRGEYKKVQLSEIQAIADNTSSILKPQVFHDLVDSKRLFLQKKKWEDMFKEDPDKVQHLMNVPSVAQVFNDASHSIGSEYINETLNVLDDAGMDILYEEALQISHFENCTREIYIVRQFPEILIKFAKELHARSSDVLGKIGAYYSRNAWLIYQDFTVTDDKDKTFTPHHTILLYQILKMICPILSDIKTLENFKTSSRSPNSFSSYSFSDIHHIDVCEYQLFLNANRKMCHSTDIGTLMEQMFRLRPDRHTSFAKIMKKLLRLWAYLYIILDAFERCVFFTLSVIYQTRPQDMIFTALGQKVPGSYLQKQLNIFSCIAFFLQYYVQTFYVTQFSFLAGADIYHAYGSLALMMFIVAIVARFLMHIHALRLLPGIGHFVITTFMMGTNLLHFSAVFGIVLLIFSMLFHILIDDPNCPLEKADGFVTFTESIFSTFKLTFGHGEMEPFFTSAPVQLTYVLYVIIVGLLLLNLIIAIMSTTAMEIMAEPWKEVLWKVEWLDEATSIEFTFSVVTLPFRKLRGFGYFFHRKAGYIVEKAANSTHKIYIECFNCPALLKQHEN